MALVKGLEIRDSNGAYIEALTTAYNATWKQAVNVADVLTFSCPTAYATNLIIGNEVWVYRGDEAELARKFVIKTVRQRAGSRAETQVDAYDYACLLMDIGVSSFPPGDPPAVGSGQTEPYVYLWDYLRQLVGRASATGIGWGTLPAHANTYVRYRDLVLDDSNVWAGLQNARQDIGGMLWVDNDKNLHWYESRFPAPGKEYKLELGRNLISVGKSYSTLGTGSDLGYEIEAIDLSAHSDDDAGLWMVGMPVTVDMPTGDPVQLYLTDIQQSLDNPLRVSAAVAPTINGTGRFRDLLDDIIDLIEETGVASGNHDGWQQSVENRVDEINNSIETITERVTDVEQGTTGVQPGYNIQNVGTVNDGGLNPEFARDDHVHALTAETVAEAITDGATDDITDAIADIIADDKDGAITDALTSIGAAPGSVLIGKFSSLDAAGDVINVNLWDTETNNWSTSTTQVLKPWILRASTWYEQTITYADGTEIYYDATDLEIKYERRATWTEIVDSTEEEFSEEQTINSPYAADQEIIIGLLPDGNYIDLNSDGRHWAVK